MRPRRARLHFGVAVQSATVESSAEKMTDGDMEAVTTAAYTAGGSATLSKNADVRPGTTGVQSLNVLSGGSSSYAAQSPVTVGRLHRLRAWAKKEAAGGKGFEVNSASGWYIWTAAQAATWEYIDKYFFSPSTSFRLYAGGSGSYARYDDVSAVEQYMSDVLGLTTTCAGYVAVPRADGTIGVHRTNTVRHPAIGAVAGARVHPAATNLMKYSDLPQRGTLTALTLTRYHEQAGHRLLETVANSAHSANLDISTMPVTLAALTDYTLSFAAYAIGARQLKVTVTLAGGGTVVETFTLTSSLACYSMAIATGAGNAGAAGVLVQLVKAGVDSYIGEVTCGAVLGSAWQLEAGALPSPHIYTANATASSVAPQYDAKGIDSWIYDRLRSPRFVFETRFTMPQKPATSVPIWSIAWGSGGVHSNLIFERTVGFGHNTANIAGTDAWDPTVGHVYRIQVTVEPAGDGRIVVVDETDEAVDLDVTWADRNWTAPSSAATVVYLGCDAAGANQWHHTIIEAEAA